MTLIIAAVVMMWATPQHIGSDQPSQWDKITTTSDLAFEVRNVVHLDGDSLAWNGRQVTEANLREYLDITTQMTPQPVLVISYSAQTSSARIEFIRSLVEDVIECTPSKCREITLRRAE